MESESPIKQLDLAKSRLRSLKVSIEKLIELNPNLFSQVQTGETSNSITLIDKADEILRSIEESQQHLNNPTLTVAMVGTTSSGKSTLTNTLIGRKLAPIEQNEMSAGILTFINKKGPTRFEIEKTEGAQWTCGVIDGWDDQQIYLSLRATADEHNYDGIMAKYNKLAKRKTKQEIQAPRIQVATELLPMKDPQFLNLPGETKFVILDLPGLKSIQDTTNYEIIQNVMKTSFSVVIMDYCQLQAPETLNLLFNEVRDIVKKMNGQTDSMCFLLNKVDCKGSSDIALSKRLSLLSEELKNELKLDKPPVILPVSARRIFAGQCAWGPRNEPLPENSPIRQALLQEWIYDNSTAVITKLTKISKEKTPYYIELLDRLEMAERPEDLGTIDITNEELTQVLDQISVESGIGNFWSVLRERISERFASLVIYPSIHKTLSLIDQFLSLMRQVSDIHYSATLEELKTKKCQLDNLFNKVLETIGNEQSLTASKVKLAFNLLKTNDLETRNQAADIFEKELKSSGFQPLLELARDVRNQLFDKIIDPVRTGLAEGTLATALEDGLLGNDIRPADAHSIAVAYDRFRQYLTPAYASNGVTYRGIKSDEGQVRTINNIYMTYVTFLTHLRDSLGHLAQIELQAGSQRIGGALIKLLESMFSSIENLVSEARGDKSIPRVALPDFSLLISELGLSLPKPLFSLPDGETPVEVENREIIRWEKNSFCIGRSPIYGNVDHIEFTLPSASAIAAILLGGVQRAESDMWETILSWMNSGIDLALASFRDYIISVGTILDDEFERRTGELATQEHEITLLWDLTTKAITNMTSTKTKLHTIAISKTA